MSRQLNIRSDRAYEIASSLARQQGKPIAAVVEEALAAYQAATESRTDRVQRWLALLREDREHPSEPDFEIEDLYDPETGLPV